jgi:hypothetical protein
VPVKDAEKRPRIERRRPAARIMREAERMKDKSSRATPIGLEVAHFMRWFRNEYGATPETLRDYEAILAKLALDHADLELADFEPPGGTSCLREFIDEHWGDAAPRTRKKVRAVERKLAKIYESGDADNDSARPH